MSLSRAIIAIILLTPCVIALETESDDTSCNHTLGIINEERRLLGCLMNGYDSAVRPSATAADAVTVTLGLPVTTIEQLNMKTSELTAHGILYQTWKDVQLSWKPSKFGNVEEIQLPVSRIWTPQITILNGFEDIKVLNGEYVTVNHAGSVTWIPHIMIRSFCYLSMKKFPFDTQHCTFQLGSKIYSGSKVKLQKWKNESQALFIYTGHEWKVKDFEVKLDPVGTSFPIKAFHRLIYSVSLKRVPSFYQYIFVGPSVVIAIATLLLFLLPAQSSERFLACSVLLLSVMMLLMTLSEYLPTNMGESPAIGVLLCVSAAFLSFNMVLLLVVELMSVVMINVHNRDGKRGKVPNWMRKIFLRTLSRLVCVETPPYTPVPTVNICEENETERELRESFENQDQPLPRSPTLALEKTLEDIRKYLRLLAVKRNTPTPTSHQDNVINEWHQLALVVDRLLFAFFTFVSIIIALALFH